MRGSLTVLLVALLSGAPGAAIVCDLLLCGDIVPVTSCHEHGAPASGDRVAAATAPCSHLAAADPYVPSALRPLLQPAAYLLITVGMPGAALTAHRVGDRASVDGPPRAPHVHPFVPLRI